MSEIKIEKGIPIPEGDGRRGRAPKYPWRNMEVGDSFFVREKPSAVARGACEAGKRCGRKFISRRIDDGVRIWRVS